MDIEQQINNTYCGQAVLQAIGKHYNRYKTQEELFKIARAVEKDFKSVDYNYGLKRDTEGTGHVGITTMAESFGLNGFIKNNATLDDVLHFIDRDIPVLVNWQLTHSPIGEHGHYSLINGYNIKQVQHKESISLNILDPLPHPDYSKYELGYREFSEFWYDFSDSQGKIKKEKWMAAFFPENMRVELPSKGFVMKKIPKGLYSQPTPTDIPTMLSTKVSKKQYASV